jgi:O-antigen/teichoic acid export membrane protein
MSTYLTKEVARKGLTAQPLVLNALLFRTFLALVVGTGAGVAASLIIDDPLTRHLVYLLSVHMMLAVIVGVLTGALQGIQELRSVAVIDGVSKLALLGLVALFLLQDYGATGVAAAYILSDLLALGCLLAAVKRHNGLSGPVSLGSWRSLFTGGLPFAVWEAALLTYARVDVILLSFFTTSAVLGWYYAAYRIISIPLFLPSILMTVVFPALSANSGNRATFNALARKGVSLAALTTMPMAFGLIVLGDKIIELFGYPAEFSNSVVPIMILAAGLPLVAVNMIIASALAALDRQKQWAIAGVGAAILNPALNLLAIPYTQGEFGNGGIGAAAVTTLTEIYLLSVALWLLPKDVLDAATFKNAAKSVLAGLTMAAFLFVGLDLSILLLVPLGALAYGVASLIFGSVSIADLRELRGHLRGRQQQSAVEA